MTNRKASASLSLDVPRLLLKYAADQGVDTAEVCRHSGVDIASSQNLEGRMSFSQFNALWEEVAFRTNDADLGLHFGEAVPGFSNGHILLGVMLNCSTLEAALERFCRYHGLLNDEPPPEMRREQQYVVFSLGYISPHEGNYLNAVLAMLTVIVRHLTENCVLPVEVRFTHPQPAHVTEYQRIFNAPLRFSQADAGLVFEPASLSTPIFLANPLLLNDLERVAQRMVVRLAAPHSWTNRTSGTMTQLLLQGEVPRLSRVAQMLVLSPRHLQNKLRAEGITFQSLLDTVRKQITLDYLNETDMTLCEIAFLLGFSEQSAFNHAFKRWTGTSPTEFVAAKSIQAN